MALGVPPRALALRPLLIGAQIALLGAALGIAIGVGVRAAWLAGVFEELLPLPVDRDAVPARGVPAPARRSASCCRWPRRRCPVWRGVRVAPIEAIRVGFRAGQGRRPRAAPAAASGCPGASLVQMPLRNLLRAPRRTMMTVLGLAR